MQNRALRCLTIGLYCDIITNIFIVRYSAIFLETGRRTASMRGNTFKRLISLALCAAMLVAAAVPVFAEEQTVTSSDGSAGGTSSGYNKTTLADLSDQLSLISYSQYLENHAGVSAGTKEIVINAADYDEKATTAKNITKESGVYGFEDEVVLTDDAGKITWSFNVEEEGMYSIKVDYAPYSSRKTNIERIFYINDEVPFSQARYMNFLKTWTFNYVEQEDGTVRFAKDASGNEQRPDAQCELKWNTMELSDSDTYYQTPFTFYFKKGTNTISLEGVRDEMYISKITLYTFDTPRSYEEKLQEYSDKGYTYGNATIHIDAEMPESVSNYTIYPQNDRSSVITEPQNPTRIMRNIIGGDSWQSTGEWAKYTFTVPQGGAGLYSVVARYKQDISDGVFVSRTVKIDGEVPFTEAYGCRFAYGTEWNVIKLGNGTYEFLFYLDEGEHTIELMATLGDFGDILSRVQEISRSLNDSYLQIMKLTGVQPDANRDYGFGRIMPEVITNISAKAEELQGIVEYIETITQSRVSSNATLESVITILKLMASDEKEIAANLSSFKDQLGSLSSWVTDFEVQPLKLDYITIQSPEAELPRAEGTSWQAFKYEISMFFGSFYTDYSSLSSMDNEGEVYTDSIECWTSSGRDQAQIMRNLVDSGFVKQNKTKVTLKLVDGGALLPSILAGIGPDVSLDPTGGVIDYAIRGVCLPLENYQDFDKVCERFDESALVPLSLYGHTYALPVSQNFPMMFVRTDILADLGIEIPETWDELLSMVPVLQYNNMDVGMLNSFEMFLYQRGGDLWDETSDVLEEKGWRVNLDDNLSLSAFEDICEMFTQYSLPVSFNSETRFKEGSMPVVITDYSFYTTITIFAPEISGLWEMVPIPGTKDAKGNINNDAIATVSGLMMIKSCRNEEAAWKFLCWYTDKDFQVDYSNELVALLGPSAKSATANLEAMAEMPWTKKEYSALLEQFDNLVGIPQYPGNYIISRYISFSFNAAYNDGADPTYTLLGYINAINSEISRKRREFKLPIYGETNKEE